MSRTNERARIATLKQLLEDLSRQDEHESPRRSAMIRALEVLEAGFEDQDELEESDERTQDDT